MKEELEALVREMRSDSERWFPQIHDGSVNLETFYALGLAGEAGEVANIAKKLMRGHDDPEDLYESLGPEIADVFVYLLLLADECDIDLLDSYHAKVVECEERWGSRAE